MRPVETAHPVQPIHFERWCEWGVSIEHLRGIACWCENCATERRRRQKTVYSRRWRDAKHLCGMTPSDCYVENPDLPDLWLCGTPDHALCGEGLVASWRFSAFYARVCSPLQQDFNSGHLIST